MNYIVHYVEEFESDLHEIVEWYGIQSEGLGAKFIKSLKVALSQITENPRKYRIRTKGSRYKHLDTFPYIIIFKIVNEELTVFGVLHDRRNPNHIKKRIK